MASGRIYGSVSQRPDSYVYYIDWSENGINVENNKSNVYGEVHILCNKHTAYQSNRYQELWIAGQLFTNSLYINLSPGTDVMLVNGTAYDIYHNGDGSKSIEIAANSQLPYGNSWRTFFR